MRVVITVSLDNNTYQIEEEAYAALRQYLDRAKSGLGDNPDVGEILADLERAISEKCVAVAGSGKGILTTEEMAAILQEVGPVVEDSTGASAPAQATTEAARPQRLYLQPKGAMVKGVCMGLAEYFDVDVVIFRILFAILTLASGGIGGGLYLLMVMIVPSREPARPTARAGTPRRWDIQPAILISTVVLILIGLLALVPWWQNGRFRVGDIIKGVWNSAFGLLGVFIALAVPLLFIGTLVLVFVAAAKYLARTKH
jgi:phage shock protein PspC (stress-responsive transcriptional regulator)